MGQATVRTEIMQPQRDHLVVVQRAAVGVRGVRVFLQTVFTLVFGLFGVASLLGGVGDLLEQGIGDAKGWFFALFGCLFVSPALGVFFARKWAEFALDRGVVSIRRGLFVPFFSRERPLADFSGIVLSYYKSFFNNQSPPYRLTLQPTQGTELHIFALDTYEEAFALAREIAVFVHFPLRDCTTAHESVFTPDPLADAAPGHLHRDEAATPLPTPPAIMHSQIATYGGNWQIHLPAPGFTRENRPTLIYILFMLLAVVTSAPVMMRDVAEKAPSGPLVAFMVVPLLFVLLLLAGLLSLVYRAKWGTVDMMVNNAGLLIERQTLFGLKQLSIPSEEIVAIDYNIGHPTVFQALRSYGASGDQFIADKRGIICKTAAGVQVVGSGLPDDEMIYLHHLITAVLAGNAVA